MLARFSQYWNRNDILTPSAADAHDCTIHDNVIVGMRAVVMDNTVIESNCIIAAGAVVLENQVLKSGYIYGGTPAKIIKELNAEATQFHITRTADAYLLYSSWYKE